MQSVFAQVRKWQKRPAGWTKDYELDWCEKYWLDPKRATQPDEQAFQAEFEKGEWIAEIERRFGLWLNACLKARFPKKATDFNDTEYQQWRKPFKQKLRHELRHLA